MAEESFLNLTCIIHSVDTPQGVYWRHNNQLLSSQSDGLLTVSPLSRRSNTTFSISLSVWLTSPRQSGEAWPSQTTISHSGGLQATISVFPPTPNRPRFLSMFSTVNTIQQRAVGVHQLTCWIVFKILAGDMLRAMYSNSNSRDLNILQPLCLYLCCYILQIAVPLQARPAPLCNMYHIRSLGLTSLSNKNCQCFSIQHIHDMKKYSIY